MFVSPIATLNMNNAAYRIMQNNNAMLGLMSFAGSGANSYALMQTEKALQMDNLNNQLLYQASSLMEDSQRKLRNENIKRTFSTFA